MNRENADRVVRFFIVIIVAAASLLSIYYASKVIYPFIIALIIATAINPVVGILERKWKFPRTLAVLTTLIVLIGIFTGLITLLIAEIVAGASYLATVVPEHVATLIKYLEKMFANQVIPFYNKLAGMFQSLDSGQRDTIMNSIDETSGRITESVTAFLQNFFLKLPGLVSWIPNAATVIIFSLLATFFISKDWERLSVLTSRLLPNKVKSSGIRVFADLKKALVGFVKAQITLISITLVIVLVGLLILRINYAITIALILGLLDLLPYLGTGTVFVPWIIYEAVTGNIGLAIGLGILYTVVIVQRQLMEPKILSSNIGLSPLGTLISLFVGFKLVGFLGLILGPVTLVLLTTLHKANVFRDIWAYIKGPPPKIMK
ncbi:sporulation integral membrane protein YtvI [Siminovitchia terrae]|uniref:Sporulation integral membrane protein YtvI n=1 Tax=Siminovitchia terrae TaxID=1914933 RepID=A0A429XAK8_SIMTE|nr:sporulation integral membrane protein YtvI [Siminovitchia terrae]RST60477.1 sporulation integral membrane protein YtvI [Siminovitchia terrae]GIN91803.1 sporulation integral membrane protein YtvI [Siminovitchia terrae]GIN98590.1 sporulation integral membrane protein YtvI [Siminovitchia terrae]